MASPLWGDRRISRRYRVFNRENATKLKFPPSKCSSIFAVRWDSTSFSLPRVRKRNILIAFGNVLTGPWCWPLWTRFHADSARPLTCKFHWQFWIEFENSPKNKMNGTMKIKKKGGSEVLHIKFRCNDAVKFFISCFCMKIFDTEVELVTITEKVVILFIM